MEWCPEVSEEQIRREREKARELRKTQWWKNRIAQGVCHYCAKACSPKDLTLDHLVPVARGGRSTKGNCVAACKECNNRKKHLLPLEWEEYLSHLEKGQE